MEQDTRKISAEQLAAVLARVDGRSPKEESSGARPVPPPSAAPESVPPSTAPQVLAAVERPVAERHVVNATLPDVPESSGKLLAAKEAAVRAEAAPPDAPPEPAPAPLEPAPPAAAAPNNVAAVEAEAERLVTGARQSGRAIGLGLVVLLFVVACVLLVWLTD